MPIIDDDPEKLRIEDLPIIPEEEPEEEDDEEVAKIPDNLD